MKLVRTVSFIMLENKEILYNDRNKRNKNM